MSNWDDSPGSGQFTIHEVTRRDIVDMLLMRESPYYGRLEDVDFLNRVWPLNEMPSWDTRFRTAMQDIRTHLGFGDWDDSYLLTVRLGLLSESDDVFLRFVETAVHPMVLTDEDDAIDVVSAINRHLSSDGFQLVETERVSGRPVFRAQPFSLLREAREPTSWAKVNRQVASMRNHLLRAESEEDFQTVGHLGREAMISLAQAVIDPQDAATENGDVPSKTDAKRLLEAYVRQALPGKNNEALRKAVRGVVQATSALVHDRSATRKDAALIAELVGSSVHLVRILATTP